MNTDITDDFIKIFVFYDDTTDYINYYDNLIIITKPNNYYKYYFYKICDTVKSILDSYILPYE
jgi:hypothetical protein